ncbi:hypothetical protein SDRG_04764 [Saprolegnia diclina VS20]|uniref:WW domain-containing protein n=1 Tax=Saprolegnia diclina (strain VS20) TaxID=1156394 RepID=T0S4Q4_SAPDV|nr:hypothetical protein SDRG_04764 [Saprolegnia diclina VS20]EQC37737.1 hypothetical protein SDRG_04764 [Saprolegnia diclina VS20]|eukprot:XP_008608670.1 hypothetical protein SDRG_04764 [Saprolegnia diclina VS20]
MPPKAARGQAETAARQARAAAQKHLAATGTGPSQYELGNQHGVGMSLERGDNTLQVLAQRRAKAHPLHESSHVSHQAAASAPRSTTGASSSSTIQVASEASASNAFATPRAEVGGASKNQLPTGWLEAKDAATGDIYYWNETTKETSWTKPGAAVEEPPVEDLPDGWQLVTDPTTQSSYYWNVHTQETQWEKPVSLAQAKAAKSKLDALLKGIGKRRFGDDDGDDDDVAPKKAKPSENDDDATLHAFLADVESTDAVTPP